MVEVMAKSIQAKSSVRRRRSKLTTFQSVALGIILITYIRLFTGHFLFPTTDCADSKEELEQLQNEERRCRLESVEHRRRSYFHSKSDVTIEATARLMVSENKYAIGECTASEAQLRDFVKYDSHNECPDDWPTAQKLMWQDQCHTLPIRTCFSVMPERYQEPNPFPEALWKLPEDRNVMWQHYECSSFECLQNRERSFPDCHHCFHLDRNPQSKQDDGQSAGLDIAGVLALKKGGIRLGLDVGGGTGSFAAEMALHNVTILTTGYNAGAPYLETMALRGMIGINLPHTARLPFFDNSLDLIHTGDSVHNLSPKSFGLMLYDWDRVLRPGGIIWIEKFAQAFDVMPEYAYRIESFQYVQHFWLIEELVEKGKHWRRLITVLEKPFHRKHWKGSTEASARGLFGS